MTEETRGNGTKGLVGGGALRCKVQRHTQRGSVFDLCVGQTEERQRPRPRQFVYDTFHLTKGSDRLETTEVFC